MRNEYDFSKAKRANEVPHLKKLQSEGKGKSRITIMLDVDVLSEFKERAREEGIGYQTLINQTLRACIGRRPVDEVTLRRVLREELHSD